MKKTLIFLKYCLYFCFSQEERDRYFMGKRRGYHCYERKVDAFGTNYYYDPTKTPEREYLNWGEYKELHNIK